MEQCMVPASLGNTDLEGQGDTNQLRLQGQVAFGGEVRSGKQARGGHQEITAMPRYRHRVYAGAQQTHRAAVLAAKA